MNTYLYKVRGPVHEHFNRKYTNKNVECSYINVHEHEHEHEHGQEHEHELEYEHETSNVPL
jgi:disulfide oxidoreductase YuzD